MRKRIRSVLVVEMEEEKSDLELLEQTKEEINSSMVEIEGEDKTELFAEEMLNQILIAITNYLPGSSEQHRVVLRAAITRKLVDLERSPELNGLFLVAMNNA